MLIPFSSPNPASRVSHGKEATSRWRLSLDRYRIVAHELGHLSGALHEDAAIQYKRGWWCESNMYPNPSALRSNCYTYSDDNQRRMRAYIVESPLSPDMAEGDPPVVD